MAVDPKVSHAFMLSELADVGELGERYGWKLRVRESEPHFEVTMRAHTEELFILDVCCANYRELPPYFEFVHPDTKERGTPKAYPFKDNGDSFFHTAPCICAPFNRKAYKFAFPNAPHGDWPYGNGEWATSNANGYDWSNVSRLGDMLMVIQKRLSDPRYYNRRMAA